MNSRWTCGPSIWYSALSTFSINSVNMVHFAEYPDTFGVNVHTHTLGTRTRRNICILSRSSHKILYMNIMILKWHRFRACGLINNKISFRETWTCEGGSSYVHCAHSPKHTAKKHTHIDEGNKWNSCRVRLAVCDIATMLRSRTKSFIFDETSFDTATLRCS